MSLWTLLACTSGTVTLGDSGEETGITDDTAEHTEDTEDTEENVLVGQLSATSPARLRPGEVAHEVRYDLFSIWCMRAGEVAAGEVAPHRTQRIRVGVGHLK